MKQKQTTMHADANRAGFPGVCANPKHATERAILLDACKQGARLVKQIEQWADAEGAKADDLMSQIVNAAQGDTGATLRQAARLASPMSRKLQHWLVFFAFRSGDYEVPVVHIFTATTRKILHRKIETYQRQWYGREGEPKFQDTRCFYFGGEVSLDLSTAELLTDPAQLIPRLKA